jgi:NAD(P)-dependent dehydrogenase (short-subunit alcohol dehydrogenase family)
MAESLKGKVAVITGVGSGFGKATAELFARLDQVNLVLIDYNEEALTATADVCKAAGSKVVALAGDVTVPETFERALNETLGSFGRVDFLINYAGGALKVAPIEEMDDAINRRIIDLNLTSAIMSCRTFTPQFKQQGYGKIINVSSACDRRSWPGWSVYSAAKAGVNAFTRCLYTELRPHGIAVMLLVPGGSNTGFQAAAEGAETFEWDEGLAVRPEHFADMVYQACALTKGACVSELVLYGIAQDVSGY